MSLYQKNLGKIGENFAIDFLKSHNFSVLEKNFRSRLGEIDIIAKKDHCLYFIEVKTRSNLNHGAPYEAVNKRKIYHIKKTAQFYLLKNKFEDYKLKVAVFSILIEDNKVDVKFWDNID
ncbi:MAG: YraN family protein [Candidatus Roizmanbacteria bacterium]|nr:YraN family protein [Candidatus Roizmanbacteria bacterium]MCR4313267.1 YraN family protein [Candidatus Roizmanbacteria bacterium]